MTGAEASGDLLVLVAAIVGLGVLTIDSFAESGLSTIVGLDLAGRRAAERAIADVAGAIVAFETADYVFAEPVVVRSSPREATHSPGISRGIATT